MTLKKWCILFSIALCWLKPIGCFACGWYPDPEWYRFSAFQPMITPGSPFRAFFFTSHYSFDNKNAAGIQNDRNRNIDEWEVYLHNKAERGDIYALLYKTNPSAFDEVYRKQYAYSQSDLNSNTFYKLLQLPASKDLMDYIVLSKKCEQACSVDDPWESDSEDTKQFEQLDTACLTRYNAATNSFLKSRYAFQLVRLYYYGGDHQKAISTFEKEFARKNTKSILKPWAMLYYAKSLSFLARDEAGLYLARCFRLCDEKKIAATISFDNSYLKRYLKYAANSTDSADILVLSAMLKPLPELKRIESIAALAPNHPAFEALVTREINKCEDLMLTEKVNHFSPVIEDFEWDKPYRNFTPATPGNKYTGYTDNLFRFMEKCSKDSLFKDQAFINLACAHLAFVLNKNDTALLFLKEAESLSKYSTEGLQLQVKLTRLMVEVNMAPYIDKELEQKIYPTAMWLRKHRNNPDALTMLHKFTAFLSSNYLHQGMVGKAAMCRRISHNYYNNTLIDLRWYNSDDDSNTVDRIAINYLTDLARGNEAAILVRLMESNNKTPFEHFLCESAISDKEFTQMLYDATGTLYLRDDSLEKAQYYFAKLPKGYWTKKDEYGYTKYQYLDANPFYAHYGDNHKHCKADSIKYNKYTFVKQLIALRKKAAAASSDIPTLLAIAHAYYNMSNYGNSWQLVSDWQSISALPNYRYYTENYFGCQAATTWYIKTLNATKENETKALCYAMLAQCEKNRQFWRYQKGRKFYTDMPDKGFAVNGYMQKLIGPYSNTKYYNDRIMECPGREAFIETFTTAIY